MTFFDATSWVGANALLRRAALEDISTTLLERGYQCKVYIQDTTLIEDTAATVDLIAKGWRLYNYPSRLAYSATPSDFGALLIQRRRWSNGGLLIFPSLLHYTFKWPLSLSRVRESLVRSHYVLSPALMSTAMLLLTFASFDDRLFTIWVPLAAVPYQILYACDLSITGRSWRDLARVYSLNMGLIVVHLGGTLQSLRQALTGRKPEFGRTPKVAGRTTTPVVYLGAIYILTLWCVFLLSADAVAGRTYHLLFTSINTMAFTYVLVVYIGVGAAVEDIRLRIKSQGLLLQAVRQRALPEPTLPVLALPAPDTAPLIEATRLTASHAGMMEGAASISPYHSGEEKSWSTARL
jgi:cellulose synthase (UDP-forming)